MKASLPGKKVSASQAPKVFVSLQPAELILLRGEPNYLAVAGREAAALGQQHRERRVPDGRSRAPSTSSSRADGSRRPTSPGPWTFATPTLPADFKQIPLEHERSRVLASVPGTTQAAEAILLAQIPQTARVSKTVQAPEVAYQGGTPEFQPIEKTTVQRAVNTDKDILKVGDLYYMCFQGVWFMSTAPTGPWEVTGEVPKQIYEIPVSSPSHAVTYVTVEESNDDAVVFATAAAFTGVMVAWGCVVWGTGYYYPPYYGFYGGYPYLLPALSDLRVRRVVQPLDRRLHARRGGLRSLRRRRRRPRATTRGPAPTRAARWPTVRTARAARRRPTTRAPARTARPGRARTCTAAGDRPASSAAISGPPPRAYTNNVTGATTRAPDTSGGGAAVSRTGPGGQHDGRPRPAAATSTPATTATSTASRATAGRSTATAAGTASSSRRRNSASRRRTARRRRRAGGQSRGQLRLGFGDREPGEPRFRGARRGRAAHARLGQRAKRRVDAIAAATAQAAAAAAAAGGGAEERRHSCS